MLGFGFVSPLFRLTSESVLLLEMQNSLYRRLWGPVRSLALSHPHANPRGKYEGKIFSEFYVVHFASVRFSLVLLLLVLDKQ